MSLMKWFLVFIVVFFFFFGVFYVEFCKNCEIIENNVVCMVGIVVMDFEKEVYKV